MVCEQPDACRTPKQIAETPRNFTYIGGKGDETFESMVQAIKNGPGEISKSFESQSASSAEAKASVNELATPFKKFNDLEGAEDPHMFSAFQQGIASLGKQPDGGTAALKDFNAVMNQYGVSLKKVGTDYALKSSDQEHTIIFDQSGEPQAVNAYGKAFSGMPQLTLIGADESSARHEFGRITLHAYAAANRVDKLATTK